MTATEFWLAWLFNFKGVFVLFAVAAGLGTVILVMIAIAATMDGDAPKELRTRAGRVLRWLAPFFLISTLVASLPDAKDLWELRVSLMKLEIVSPENFGKLAARADEVVSAVECKYLNVHCPEQKKVEK